MIMFMEMGTRELAETFGLTDQRVRAMIADGSLEARRVGGRWLVDSAVFEASRRSGRAMTEANAWRFLSMASGVRDIDNLRAEERYRLRQRLSRLLESEVPTMLLRTWLANRAVRIEYEASDAGTLEQDSRVMPTGISDDGSGLTRSNEAEGYVLASELRSIEMDNALFRTSRGTGNVVLHAVDDAYVGHLRPSALLTAADLSEHSDVRARAQAERLVDGLRA